MADTHAMDEFFLCAFHFAKIIGRSCRFARQGDRSCGMEFSVKRDSSATTKEYRPRRRVRELERVGVPLLASRKPEAKATRS